MKKLVLCAMMVCGAFLFNSCSKDTDCKGTQVETKQPSDWTITARVKKAIMSDNSLSTKAKFVSVSTRRGVVTLTGTVPCKNDMDEIVSVVRKIDGVVSVNNQLNYPK